MKRKYLYIAIALLVALSMILAACAPAATETPAATQAPAEQPAEEPAGEMVELGGVEYSTAYQGTTVTYFSVAADEQLRLFQSEFDEFTEATGITVQAEGNKDFETLILVRVEGDDAPDIAGFAQPGLLADFVRKGNIVDLSTFLTEDFLKTKYSQGLIDLSKVDGKVAGVWHNADVKSLVWYPKAEFDAKGYKIPQTWDELKALSDQILADGGTPWCIGIGSEGATGWVGTDWVEDVMLRTTTRELRCLARRVNSTPPGQAAFDTVILVQRRLWYGGVPNILTTLRRCSRSII
jgi:alpha-glucoside transport system substrate-binding protein